MNIDQRDYSKRRPLPVVLFLVLGLLATTSVLSACGGKKKRDLPACAGVTCEYGVCDDQSGKCVNAEQCSPVGMSSDAGSAADAGTADAGVSRISECLEGYSCVDGACEADAPCEADGECKSGKCERGACVNKDSCTPENADTACIDGYKCNAAGKCVIDPCASKTCERGVCDSETGECVNQSSCPADDGEPPACLDGYKCHSGTCHDEESFCNELECDRGVCSFEKLACDNADPCTGDDECLSGSFCNNQNKCEKNVCDKNMVDCPRGVCEASTGNCVNAESCSEKTDCISMHWCVQGSCVKQTEACGKEGCPGNQVCTYDEGNQAANCQENPNEGCTNTLDCTGDRICRDGQCNAASASTCMKDNFESNDKESNATSYFDNKNNGKVSANICSGDTDVFTYDTSKDSDSRGKFFVDLNYVPVDVGLGTLEVEVIDPSGKTVATKQAGMSKPGEVHIEDEFKLGTSGAYTIKVRDTGDVRKIGVRYELRADIVSQSVLNACKMPKTLKMPKTTGSSLSGNSVALDASCVSGGDKAAEDIYEFTLSDESYVEIDVTPQGGADISASVRTACARINTEEACANDGAADETESIRQTMEPGTYYLIVQGPKQQTGGKYEIDFSAEKVVCTSKDNTCVNQNKAKICNSTGTKLEEIECAMGCDMQKGVCKRPKADACYTAVDATGGMMQTQITWDNLKDDLNPGAKTCLSDSSPPSDGPDAIYKVDLKPNEALLGKLTLSSGQNGSLYLLNKCGDAAKSCQKGAEGNGDTVEVAYENTSSTSETVFVVADSASGTTGTAKVEIDAGKVVCKTGETKCQMGNVATCNKVGTGYRVTSQCSGGCTMGACTGDKCGAFIDASKGGQWTVDITNFKDDYALSDSDCTGDALPAPDVVFKVDLQAKEWVTAKVTPQGSSDDPAIYIVEDCMSTSTHAKTCLDGTDGNFGGSAEQVAAQAPSGSSTTYYVVVDGDDNSQATGKWDVDIKIQSPQCTPGSTRCKSGSPDTLQYCGKRGLAYSDYKCQGSSPMCSSSGGTAKCNNPTGTQCYDPIPAKDGDSKTGDFTGNNNLEMPSGRIGGCTIDDATDSPETIYEVDLAKDDLLEAKLTTSWGDAMIYVLGDCYSKSSCRASLSSEGAGTVRYHASQKETVFVVVDGNFSTGSSTSYTVDFSISSNKTCAPGTAKCTNQNTVGICNSSGSGYASSTSCKNGCQNGACQFQNMNIDTCGTAPDIGNGTIAYGDYDQLSDDVTMPSGGCAGLAGDGPDAAYKVQVNSGEVLTAEVDSLGLDQPVLYATTNCSMADSACVAGNAARSAGGTAKIGYKANANQTVYVVADSEQYDDDPYQIDIQVQQSQCTPGTIQCGGQGKKLQKCNSYGLWDSVTCNGGCSNNKCNNPSGEVCYDPIKLTSGQKVTDSWSGSSSFELSKNRTGGCFIDNLDNTAGPDRVYAVDLSSGQLLEAKLSTSESDAMLVIAEQCSDPSTCVTNNAGGGATTQHYYATSQTTAYVIVDSMTSSPSGQYTLEVNVKSGTCAPGDTHCVNSNTVGVCDSTGSSFSGKYSCANGCANGACKTTKKADTCSSAPTIGNGFVAYHDFSKLTNDVSISSSASCVSSGGSGNEAIYKVNVSAGDIIHAKSVSRGAEAPLVYIVEDCTKPDSTCVAGGGSQNGVAEAYYKATGSKTVSVVADTTSSGYDEPFELRIEKLKPQCTQGQRQCTSNGQDLQYCNSVGLWNTYSCQGGCSSAKCNKPTGDICLDAISLKKNGSYSSSFSNFNADINPGTGTCGFLSSGSEPTGSDAVFAVDLDQGDILTANLQYSGFYDTSMYVLGSCSGGASSTCLHGAPSSQKMQFFASKKKTYYLVVDIGSTFATGNFSLNLSTTTGGSCQPGAGSCSSGTLTICKDDGSGTRGSYSCPTRGCTNGYCDKPSTVNDTCSSALSIPDGVRLVDRFDRFKDDYDIASGTNSCNAGRTGGFDAVYTMPLADGEFVEVSVDPQGITDDPSIQIVTNCQMPASSCVANDDANDAAVQTGYLNDTGSQQKIFIIVDSEGSSDTDDFILDVHKGQKECTPNSMNPPKRCADANTSETCNSYGKYVAENCHYGCNSSTGACTPPPNDKCGGAISLQSGKTYKAPIDEFADDYDVSPQSGTSCTGGDSPGPDAVYAASLNKGDVLDLEWTSPGDPAIWITTNCSQAASNCAKGVDTFQDTESMLFTAPSTGTYYVIADVDSSSAVSGMFELEANFVGTPNCNPGGTTCSSSQLKYCVEPGYYRSFACSGGCSSGACGSPSGEICADAINASGGGTFTFDAGASQSDYDMSLSSCVGDTTPASDGAYVVPLQPGEILDVTVTPQNSGDDPAVFVTSRCGRTSTLENACLAGADSGFAGTKESVRAKNTTGQQRNFWVIVDGDDASEASGKWDVKITTSQPSCTAGQASCSGSNPDELQYCDAWGTSTKTYTCQGSSSPKCQSGRCQAPTGEICADFITVPPGGKKYTVDYTNFADDYQMTDGSCTGDATNGPDAVYRVQAQAGQQITAKLTPQNSSDDPAVYITSTCYGAVTSPSQSCVAGADANFGGGNETASYKVPSGQAGYYWVFVDTDDASQAGGKVDVDITVQ